MKLYTPQPPKKLIKNSSITFLMSLHNWKSCYDAEVDNENDVSNGFNNNTEYGYSLKIIFLFGSNLVTSGGITSWNAMNKSLD